MTGLRFPPENFVFTREFMALLETFRSAASGEVVL
jgi:hypothetical protein